MVGERTPASLLWLDGRWGQQAAGGGARRPLEQARWSCPRHAPGAAWPD